MKYTFTRESLKEIDKYSEFVEMSGLSPDWSDQANLFFRFLVAQGFMLSERDIAEYFTEQANEVGNIRDNNINCSPTPGECAQAYSQDNEVGNI